MKSSKLLDRRNFIRQGTQVAAFSTLVPAAINREILSDREQKTDLLYRNLGKTGIRVPIIGMGTGDTDNPNLVKAAMDAGIVFFDTAHGYQRGENEKMLGEVFKEVEREKIIIQTKVPPESRGKEDIDDASHGLN